jgi:hypothetical protein
VESPWAVKLAKTMNHCFGDLQILLAFSVRIAGDDGKGNL